MISETINIILSTLDELNQASGIASPNLTPSLGRRNLGQVFAAAVVKERI